MVFKISRNPKHPLYFDLHGLFCPARITRVIVIIYCFHIFDYLQISYIKYCNDKTIYTVCVYIYIFFLFMNGNTEWAQCALSRVCIP